MSSREVEGLFNAALECSIYLAPKEPGLSYDEFREIGKKAGFLKGETEDTITKMGQQSFGGASRRLLPNQVVITLLGTLIIKKDPEYRNISAFDFVYSQINYVIRAEGIKSAQIDRNVLVERAIAQSIPELDVEAAITIMVMGGQLSEKNNQLRPVGLASNYEQLPSQQRGPAMNVRRSEERERAYSFVREIVERRSSNQPPKAQNGAAAMSDIERSKSPSVVENALSPASTSTRKKVFIGHGRSPVWRELKDFLQDRLRLTIDEFNNTPTAGIATANRLKEMLDVAAFAFMVMTAEDEQPDGKFNARLNVIHEVGLFQGCLGFEKAIILIEEGCEEFSNIHGLGQIRFPKGNISAVFENIRLVLERINPRPT